MKYNKGSNYNNLILFKESIFLKIHIVILCISIVIWVLITINFYKATEQVNLQKAEVNNLLGITEDMNESEIQRVKEGFLTDAIKYVTLNPHVIFEEEKSTGNMEFSNMKNSEFSYIVTVKLDDTGKEIYKSGLIEPGYMVKNVNLENKLNKGKYIATAEFKIYFNNSSISIGTIVRSMVVEVI